MVIVVAEGIYFLAQAKSIDEVSVGTFNTDFRGQERFAEGVTGISNVAEDAGSSFHLVPRIA